MTKHYDIIIIGGGLNGLCTAFQLIQKGYRNIVLLEARTIGHDLGSSHGKSRITRSAYSDACYVQMMQYCHQVSWPELEKTLNQSFRYPCKGLFYGPEDGLFQKYRDAILEAGANVEQLSTQKAKEVFPQFNFTNNDGILQDHTSAVIGAEQTISALKTYCQEHIDVLENHPVLDIDNSDPILRFQLENEELRAEKCIITAGAWTTRLIPELQTRLKVVHQNVYYLNIESPRMGEIGKYPVWVELGMNIDEMYYGLPEFQRKGIKVAKHHFQGDDDPNIKIRPPESDDQAFIKRFQTRLNIPIKSIESWERCQYTYTENEDFILDFHPQDQRIVIGAGFSGHGFKFGPLTGKILTDLLLDGKTDVVGYARSKFGFNFSKG